MAAPSPSPVHGEDRPEDRLDNAVATIVEALTEDDPIPLTDHLAARGVDVERIWELPRWNAAFAADVQAGVAARLSGPETLTARPGRYHVLVSVHEASAGVGPGTPGHLRRPVVSGDDLLGLFGAQALLAPVPNAIGSLCDWSRYAVRQAQLLHDVRKSGDLVASTENTTVIALFGTPSFVVGGLQTMAEFVGSLDGLFSAWHDRLASQGTCWSRPSRPGSSTLKRSCATRSPTAPPTCSRRSTRTAARSAWP